MVDPARRNRIVVPDVDAVRVPRVRTPGFPRVPGA